MSNKKLVILGVVAACMVIWAVVQSQISKKPREAPSQQAYLIQGLDPADIGSIVLGADNAVTLKRTSRGFVVTNKDDYPADPKQINDLITSCLSIKVGELFTDNPKNHEDLEVTEKDARNIVKFLRGDSSVLAGVIVGKTKEQGQGSYVRLASSDKVYLTADVPWIRNRPMDYIDQKLTQIDHKDIESVTVTSPDDKYTLKAKEDSDGIELENIPAGKKLKVSDAKKVFDALTYLSFEDVKKRAGENEEFTFDKVYACKLKDSSIYTLRIAEKDKTYITCEAEYTDQTPVLKKLQEVESEEELKEKEAKLLAKEKAKKFALVHKAWIYKIPQYKADNMTKKLVDLLEDEPKPEKSEAQENTTLPEAEETEQ